MTDRSLAIWGLLTGIVGIVLAVIGLWFAVIVSPWGTRNDYFCFEHQSGKSCYYTRANCETEQQRSPYKVTRECEHEEGPFPSN
jgi:hypothetical protein